MSRYLSKTFAKYLRLGVVPRLVSGNWKDGDYMYSVYHDDVQYTIDDMGDYELDLDISYILDCLHARDLIIERNHAIVRNVYEHLVDVLDDDVWVRVNSGIQLSCTFGDRNGAFAHFLMDFAEQKDFEAVIDKFKKVLNSSSEFAGDFVPPDDFVIMVTSKSKLALFDNFEHPKIKVLNISSDEE